MYEKLLRSAQAETKKKYKNLFLRKVHLLQ